MAGTDPTLIIIIVLVICIIAYFGYMWYKNTHPVIGSAAAVANTAGTTASQVGMTPAAVNAITQAVGGALTSGAATSSGTTDVAGNTPASVGALAGQVASSQGGTPEQVSAIIDITGSTAAANELVGNWLTSTGSIVTITLDSTAVGGLYIGGTYALVDANSNIYITNLAAGSTPNGVTQDGIIYWKNSTANFSGNWVQNLAGAWNDGTNNYTLTAASGPSFTVSGGVGGIITVQPYSLVWANSSSILSPTGTFYVMLNNIIWLNTNPGAVPPTTVWTKGTINNPPPASPATNPPPPPPAPSPTDYAPKFVGTWSGHSGDPTTAVTNNPVLVRTANNTLKVNGSWTINLTPDSTGSTFSIATIPLGGVSNGATPTLVSWSNDGSSWTKAPASTGNSAVISTYPAATLIAANYLPFIGSWHGSGGDSPVVTQFTNNANAININPINSTSAQWGCGISMTNGIYTLAALPINPGIINTSPTLADGVTPITGTSSSPGLIQWNNGTCWWMSPATGCTPIPATS